MVFDFIKITGSTGDYNFHSHTQFCDGRYTMEEMVKAAITAGMRYWGFSPHSPILFPSPCNMSMESVDIYLSEVKRLKEIYGNCINLYTSMEIDYIGDEWGPAVDYFQNLPLDYRIGSVHFIPSEHGMIDVDGKVESFKLKMRDHFHDDIRYVVDTFYDQSEKMLQAGGFDIIGHFDKIGYNASCYSPGIEDEPWYKARVNDLIDLIIEKNVVVEINTKAWEQAQRIFPKECYLKRLAENHVTMVVNSDAHYTEKVNEGRNYGLSLIDKYFRTN